jgi:hypothetical protein
LTKTALLTNKRNNVGNLFERSNRKVHKVHRNNDCIHCYSCTDLPSTTKNLEIPHALFHQQEPMKNING